MREISLRKRAAVFTIACLLAMVILAQKFPGINPADARLLLLGVCSIILFFTRTKICHNYSFLLCDQRLNSGRRNS